MNANSTPTPSQTPSDFTCADGTVLAFRHWPCTPARAQILLIHGLGEHCGRYASLAAALNTQGFDVIAYDHYGHGRSSGRRGHLGRDTQLVDHLVEVWAELARRFPAMPRILLGHSLGGLIAASAVAHGRLTPHALVLSSPALAIDVAPWQQLALKVLPQLVPNLALPNGVDPRLLAHDPEVARAYRADPLVSRWLCVRLGEFVIKEGAAVIARAPDWRVPTLLLYAGDDRLVSPRGSAAFAARAPTSFVQARCFPGLYHEIFNEPDEAPRQALNAWLKALG